jgi:hypothetical protein
VFSNEVETGPKFIKLHEHSPWVKAIRKDTV